MRWIHIDFFIQTSYSEREYWRKRYLDEDNKFAFEDLLRAIISGIRPFIRRKFYLYEPQPNCFLALELRSILFLPIIKLIIWALRSRVWFVKQIVVHAVPTHDEANGDGFLNIMNAFTDYHLFTQAGKGAKLSHIIHCAINMQYHTRYEELIFYGKMYHCYKPEESKKRKVKNDNKS